MSYYATKLAEHECGRIRKTVTVTSLIGDLAHEDSQRELNERNAEMARLKATVAINPSTGRATDIDAFVAMCHKIVDLPHSATALIYSLSDILEVTKSSDYPQEDRWAIVEAFSYVRQKGHIDSCAGNQLYLAMHLLRYVDHPDPQAESYFSDNNPLFQDTRSGSTYHAPKGPRHFRPSPLKK